MINHLWQFLSSKNINDVSLFTLIIELALCYFWLLSKVKITMKSKCFELILDIKGTTTAQLKTRGRTPKSAGDTEDGEWAAPLGLSLLPAVFAADKVSMTAK